MNELSVAILLFFALWALGAGVALGFWVPIPPRQLPPSRASAAVADPKPPPTAEDLAVGVFVVLALLALLSSDRKS